MYMHSRCLTLVALCVEFAFSGIPAKAQEWVDAFTLQKQVYGNFLGITYNSEMKVSNLPHNFEGGTRLLHGDIYNLYTVNTSDTSGAQAGFPLHSLEGDEAYYYHAGDGPLTLFEFDLEARRVRNISIGASVPGRDRPQHTIAGRTLTGALLAEGTTWALTGAGTTPGFDPRDSHMAADNQTLVHELYLIFPEHTALIDRLTSFH
jgi:predicted cupin superfamily sugar epimerase